MKTYQWLTEVLTSPDIPEPTKVLAGQIYPALGSTPIDVDRLTVDADCVHRLADMVIPRTKPAYLASA